jgi:hypothetical protein
MAMSPEGFMASSFADIDNYESKLVKDKYGNRYVEEDFYMKTLEQRDELIEEQRQEIAKLRTEANNWKQKAQARKSTKNRFVGRYYGKNERSTS